MRTIYWKKLTQNSHGLDNIVFYIRFVKKLSYEICTLLSYDKIFDYVSPMSIFLSVYELLERNGKFERLHAGNIAEIDEFISS